MVIERLGHIVDGEGEEFEKQGRGAGDAKGTMKYKVNKALTKNFVKL